MGGRRKSVVLWALTLAVAGCSSGSADTASTETPAADSSIVETPSTEAPSADTEAASAPSTATSGAADADSSTSVEPLRPYTSSPSTTEPDYSTSAWISRKSMSDSNIELTWSSTDGAVEYQIHRLPRAVDDQPEVAEMTAENLIHTATDAGQWTDDGVLAGTPYWYGVRSLAADGTLVAHGWHRAAAVTDEEPPTEVGALAAVVGDDGVLVTWTQPDENYELHGYRVLRGVDGQEPELISNTWKVSQTSFLDDDPPAGQVTYQIVAFDFHWNESAPADVVIDLS